MLSTILNNNGRPSLIANAGVGGSASGPSFDPGLTSNHGVGRINSDLAAIKSFYEADRYYVLILYGVNDYAYDIGPSTTRMNIEIIIDAAIANGVTPIVGTIPPCSCQSLQAVQSVNANIAAAVASKQGEGKSVYLVDHYQNLAASWNSLSDLDGVHPTNTGYQIIAQEWFDDRLKNLLPVQRSVVIPAVISLLLGD
jgi:lysophospholipase L1-like esterase